LKYYKWDENLRTKEKIGHRLVSLSQQRFFTHGFTVGIINKSLIIPMEDLRLTSFGPNDIDNIDEVAEINFGLLSKKAKR
jgi:hypothetical protein